MSFGYDEVSQLQTRIAILESQLDVKAAIVGNLKSEIERLTNLVGSLIKKDKWDGETIEPKLEYHIGENNEKGNCCDEKN
jgi:hypothetical protein